MTEDVSISHPLTVRPSSKEEAAFRLMHHIGGCEKSPDAGDRKYWLTLYHQCYKAANGASLESVLQKN